MFCSKVTRKLTRPLASIALPFFPWCWCRYCAGVHCSPPFPRKWPCPAMVLPDAQERCVRGALGNSKSVFVCYSKRKCGMAFMWSGFGQCQFEQNSVHCHLPLLTIVLFFMLAAIQSLEHSLAVVCMWCANMCHIFCTGE